MAGGLLRIIYTIEGLQEAQDRNLRRIAALKPRNALGRAIQFIAAGAHRYAVSITPVDTGAWRASHRIRENLAEGIAEISIDPSARNPRSLIRVLTYASVWEAEGADYAVYMRTVNEVGDDLVREALNRMRRDLEL